MANKKTVKRYGRTKRSKTYKRSQNKTKRSSHHKTKRMRSKSMRSKSMHRKKYIRGGSEVGHYDKKDVIINLISSYKAGSLKCPDKDCEAEQDYMGYLFYTNENLDTDKIAILRNINKIYKIKVKNISLEEAIAIYNRKSKNILSSEDFKKYEKFIKDGRPCPPKGCSDTASFVGWLINNYASTGLTRQQIKDNYIKAFEDFDNYKKSLEEEKEENVEVNKNEKTRSQRKRDIEELRAKKRKAPTVKPIVNEEAELNAALADLIETVDEEEKSLNKIKVIEEVVDDKPLEEFEEDANEILQRLNSIAQISTIDPVLQQEIVNLHNSSTLKLENVFNDKDKKEQKKGLIAWFKDIKTYLFNLFEGNAEPVLSGKFVKRRTPRPGSVYDRLKRNTPRPGSGVYNQLNREIENPQVNRPASYYNKLNRGPEYIAEVNKGSKTRKIYQNPNSPRYISLSNQDKRNKSSLYAVAGPASPGSPGSRYSSHTYETISQPGTPYAQAHEYATIESQPLGPYDDPNAASKKESGEYAVFER